MSVRPARIVARWEFERFAKAKDLVLGVLFFVVTFGVFGLVGEFVERRNQKPRDIAVVKAELMGLDTTESLQQFRLLPQTRKVAELEEALAEEEFDALLLVRGPDQAELRVREESGWQEEFMLLLTAHRQAQRPSELGLADDVLTRLASPVDITRVQAGRLSLSETRAETLTVLVVVGTMLFGLFLGFSYVFVAITGEKTQHVTESVLAAITPQQWIDGKIAGLTLVTLVNVICYGLGYLVYKVIAVVFFDGTFDLPVGIGDPLTFALLVAFAMLGFGFWFTLFALIAATINDPNSSSRTSFMMLPFLPLGLTLVGLDQPDALWMRLLSILPGISPAAMPVRLLRGDPAWIEIVISLALLAVMIWIFRRTAGRIFGVSMLMTGKEPSWSEVWRWVKET